MKFLTENFWTILAVILTIGMIWLDVSFGVFRGDLFRLINGM